MGALMVVDPQPAARYLPAEPYINRAAPKSKRLGKKSRRQRGGEDKRNHRTGEERNQGKTGEKKNPDGKKPGGKRRK
jgi:hypothetical protein